MYIKIVITASISTSFICTVSDISNINFNKDGSSGWMFSRNPGKYSLYIKDDLTDEVYESYDIDSETIDQIKCLRRDNYLKQLDIEI